MSKMHANEFNINLSLVQKLVRQQFPEWAHLPLKSVPSAGTDNALYRLGDDLVVRLPRIDWAVSGAGAWLGSVDCIDCLALLQRYKSSLSG